MRQPSRAWASGRLTAWPLACGIANVDSLGGSGRCIGGTPGDGTTCFSTRQRCQPLPSSFVSVMGKVRCISGTPGDGTTCVETRTSCQPHVTFFD